jgi:hypothetical protein
LAPEGQSKDHRGKTVVDGAPRMGFPDAPRNSAPFAPLTLLHNHHATSTRSITIFIHLPLQRVNS